MHRSTGEHTCSRHVWGQIAVCIFTAVTSDPARSACVSVVRRNPYRSYRDTASAFDWVTHSSAWRTPREIAQSRAAINRPEPTPFPRAGGEPT